MAITYPPAPPTFSGDMQTVNRFLSTPTLVSRRATEIARQRFISDVLLTSRTDVAGGAIVFEQDDPLYVERPVEMVSPGGEYPQTGLADAVPQAVKVNKWGQDVPITDEKIKRSNFAAVEKALTRLVNTAVRNCDSISLSLIASQVTQTQAVTDGAWVSSTKILRDIMLAKATIIGLNKGYDPNVLVVDDTTWAYLASDPAIQTARAREDSANTIYTGEFPSIAGLTILPTPNLPRPALGSSTPTPRWHRGREARRRLHRRGDRDEDHPRRGQRPVEGPRPPRLRPVRQRAGCRCQDHRHLRGVLVSYIVKAPLVGVMARTARSSTCTAVRRSRLTFRRTTSSALSLTVW
ncbi:hypothetical protein GS539_19460 [Rhodococcus hoagii]|nr:hypothetical protein [Prescottella equi]